MNRIARLTPYDSMDVVCPARKTGQKSAGKWSARVGSTGPVHDRKGGTPIGPRVEDRIDDLADWAFRYLTQRQENSFEVSCGGRTASRTGIPRSGAKFVVHDH